MIKTPTMLVRLTLSGLGGCLLLTAMGLVTSSILPFSMVQAQPEISNTRRPLEETLESKLNRLYKKSELVSVVTTFEVTNGEKDNTVTFDHRDPIKGPPFGRRYRIRYALNETLPALASNWVIFVETAVPKNGAMETTGGAEGRFEYTKEIKKLLDQIASKNDQ